MRRVRIVGGAWRSRLLDVPHASGLRPTPDRVRATLFNWLGQDLDGLNCLDLFAGTGILGFEAASRGAAHVTLVEKDGGSVDALRKAAETLKASQVEIIRGDAVKFVQSTSRAGLILRVGLGGVIFAHGAQKLLGWFGGNGFDGTMEFFTQRMVLLWLVAFLVIIGESLGPLGLIAGFLPDSRRRV